MNPIVVIDDPADPRVAPYRDVREADLVGREGRFVIEGEVVLRTCVREAPQVLESVLLAQKRIDGLADLIADLPEGTPVYAAAQGVLDGIVGFHIHRGVLAIGRRAPEPDPDALLGGLGARALVVGIFGVGNHDNMGGILRNCAAFGVDAVLIGADCCDPLYRKAIRVSVGAAVITPSVRLQAGVDPVALLQRHGFEAVGLSPAGEIALMDMRRPARAALLLGAEGPGLPAAMLDRVTRVSIPMAGGFDSLNVATTSGIALYQLALGR